MNTNLIHNILNVAMAALAAALLASGCVAVVGGSFDCSQSWINPMFTTAAIAGMGFAKIAMNLWRDGFLGMFKTQPPVV